MAIEKVVNIVVKETGIADLTKKVNALENSIEGVEDAQAGLAKSMKGSTNSVLENGSAMGLLNDATGGLAMTVKDAVEASVLFTKSQKASAIAQGFYTTVVGSSTGAMKLFRIALVSTGIGAIIVGLGLLIANFDKVKKVVLNLLPGLKLVGDFVMGIVQAVTDFVGVTSDASRELEKLGEQANKTLEKNKFFLDAYGDKYDEYTKRKIEANNKYAEHVKAINEDETLSEEEKLDKLKLLRERANRDILDAENDRNEMLDKKRKEAQDKIDAAEKIRKDKLAEAEKKAQEEDRKKAEEQAAALLNFQVTVSNSEIERKEEEHQAEIENIQRQNDEIYAAEEAQSNREVELAKKTLEDIKKIEEAKQINRQATIDLISTGFDSISSLTEAFAGKSKKAQAKAIKTQGVVALAQIGSNTASGIMNAIGTSATVYEGAAKAIAIGILGITQTAINAKNTSKALSALGESGGGGGGGSAGGGGIAAPSFNLVQGTNTNQIANSIGEQKPVQAFVVASNVTTQAGLDRNIVKEASLG